MSQLIDEFVSFYRDFSVSSLVNLDRLYTETAVFEGPIHKVQGLQAIEKHFGAVMKGIIDCRFEFESVVETENTAFLEWFMCFHHARLGKQEITVSGISVIRFDDKIFAHRDYYDMGELLYENVPIIGRAVLKLKRKLATTS